MERMPVSQLEAGALQVLQEVQRSGRGLVITLEGRPLVEIQPSRDEWPAPPALGTGRDWTTARVNDEDLVAENTTADWEMEG